MSHLTFALLFRILAAASLMAAPHPGGDECGAASFPDEWIHGAPDCATSDEPLFQLHALDERTFILRQGRCVTNQAPFVYLLLGDDRALLIDSGFSTDPQDFPIRTIVERLIREWHASMGLGVPATYETIVAHTHRHGDHTAGDGQFAGASNTRVVGTSLASVQQFFGFQNWPSEIVQYDLGNRVIDVIPTPGHTDESLSFYDRCSTSLFTGDTLLPGTLLVFESQPDFAASIARLFAFSQANPVGQILGGHVEMSSTPGVLFPIGVSYQPDEHELQLSVMSLRDLHGSILRTGLPLKFTVFDDFVLAPF